MSLDIRWLAAAAIYAVAPQCVAAKYMSVDQARALIFPFADEADARGGRSRACGGAGFERVDVEPTRIYDEHFMSAFIRAQKPAAAAKACCGPTCCA